MLQNLFILIFQTYFLTNVDVGVFGGSINGRAMEYLIVSGEHASEHHKVSTSSDGLGHITGASAATVLFIEEIC